MSLGQSTTIGKALVTYLQGMQYNSAPLYSLAKYGAVVDPTDVVTFASVTFVRGITKRFTAGWKIDDHPIFLIESGFSMTDSTVAETQLTDVRDLLINTFSQTFILGGSIPGVYDTRIVDEPDESFYKAFPNGVVYRIHHLKVQVLQQYNVQPVP